MTESTRKALDTMKAEALRGLESDTVSCRKAWFYTHAGAIEAAHSFGLIDENEFQSIHGEWMKHNPGR